MSNDIKTESSVLWSRERARTTLAFTYHRVFVDVSFDSGRAQLGVFSPSLKQLERELVLWKRNRLYNLFRRSNANASNLRVVLSSDQQPSFRCDRLVFVVRRCQWSPRKKKYRHYMIQCPMSLLACMWVRVLCVTWREKQVLACELWD